MTADKFTTIFCTSLKDHSVYKYNFWITSENSLYNLQTKGTLKIYEFKTSSQIQDFLKQLYFLIKQTEWNDCLDGLTVD